MSTYETPKPGSLSAPPSIGLIAEHGVLRAVLNRVRALTARSLFLSLALPVGIYLVFAIPPFQGLDEISHFFHTYSISGGALVATKKGVNAGNVLPACIPAYGFGLYAEATKPGAFRPSDYFTLPAGCASRPDAFTLYNNTAVYSPVSYVPQAIGVAIARGLGAPLPIVFYTGRLFAILAFVGLVALA